MNLYESLENIITEDARTERKKTKFYNVLNRNI